MSLCFNPDCSHKNVATDKFCQKSCSKLLLREPYRVLKSIDQGGFDKTFQAVDEDKLSKPHCIIKQFLPSAHLENKNKPRFQDKKSLSSLLFSIFSSLGLNHHQLE
jgi:hypothetical protein